MTKLPGSRWAFAAVVADMDGVLIDAAEAHVDVLGALERWRRGGLGIAVASRSRECAMVLEFAGLGDQLDVIVDAAHEPTDRRALLGAAARRLGLAPARVIALEADEAGVRAACEAGFGLVVGVDRRGNGHADELARAGADRVVRDLGRLRFLRMLPSALERRAELLERRAGRELVVVLDFDGTLAPRVDDPADARVSEAMRSCLAKLASCGHVVVVGGRDRHDLEARIGLSELIYAGCDGLEIVGAGICERLPAAEAALAQLDHAHRRLQSALARIPGLSVERRRYAVAARCRGNEREADLSALRAIVAEVQRETGLYQRRGRQVIELEPPLAWDRGCALAWILELLGRERWPVYVGDDETDEPGFAAVAGAGLGIRVGSALSCSLADYCVGDLQELRELLGTGLASPRTR